GVGAGNFNTHYLRYASRIGMSGTDYGERGEHEFPHGLYIEIGSETGVLGLIAFAGIVLAILGSLWNARHAFLVRDDTRHAIVASGVAAAIAGYLIASVFLHESAIRYFGLYVGFGIAIARLARVEPAAPAGVRNTFLSQLDWSSLGTRVIRVLQYNERKDGTIALVSLNDREVFAKQHGPDGRAPGEIARYEADLLQTLRAQLPPPYSVPEVLLVDEQHGAIVLARAPGTPLDALLRNARTRFAAGDLVHAVQRAGRWLGLMQKITRTNEDGHARLETLLEQAMDDLASLPSLGGRRPDIANSLHGLHNEVKLQLLPVVGQHGDYWPGNIFIDGERVEVIDFEGFRPGLPLEDVTYFLTYLDLMPLMRRHLPALATSFIEGWNGDTRALELFRLLHALRALVRSESGPPSLFQLYTNYRLRKFILGSLQ
ncbi:MAG: phosphotransferase, partial [Thermoanaerobaculia bacterium]